MDESKREAGVFVGQGAGEGRLRLVAGAGRPLTKAQKKFDRLLRKVENLRSERERLTKRWELFLAIYVERIEPEERRLLRRREELVRLLAEVWRKPKGLGKRQREDLAELISRHLRALFDHSPERFAGELRTLWEELNPPHDPPAADEDEAPGAEAAGEGGGASVGMPPELEEMFRRAGVDTSAFRPGMTPEDCLREAERQLREREGADGGGPGPEPGETEEPPPSRRKSARQEAAERKAEERRLAREEARKRSVVAIYKQLAKVLHPDLERDPEARARKELLMQDLTKAYREGDLHTLLRLELAWIKREEGDLHTLLRLELAWIKREEGDLERLGDDKLGIYSELLEEQVVELQEELQEVRLQPRFAVVARFCREYDAAPEDPESVLLSIRRTSEGLRRFRDELGGPEAREVLRETLRAMAQERRRAGLWDEAW